MSAQDEQECLQVHDRVRVLDKRSAFVGKCGILIRIEEGLHDLPYWVDLGPSRYGMNAIVPFRRMDLARVQGAGSEPRT